MSENKNQWTQITDQIKEKYWFFMYVNDFLKKKRIEDD